MKNSNHSFKSFNSYLESMCCQVVDSFVSIEVNHITKLKYTKFAAIIFTGVPGLYVVAYKFTHMSEPYIESTKHTISQCYDIVNDLLKH